MCRYQVHSQHLQHDNTVYFSKTAIFIGCMGPMRRAFWAVFVGLATASACVWSQNTIYLLGEVHDNPAVHSERMGLIENLVSKNFRPVIAMEQFDRENQALLNQAMSSCKTSDCVVQKVGGRGWEWHFYKPVIDIAIKHGLTLIAANLSSKDAMSIATHGFGSALSAETLHEFNLDKPLDKDLFQKQKLAIDEGHCHALPPSAFKGMVNAQVARDVWMAKTIRENAANGLILLAGNGHVRKDIGVYRWLSSNERGRTEVIAYTEDHGDTLKEPEASLYDRTFRLRPFERDDPCKAFQGKSKRQA
jgi:uncharacterized iron-regulated protein